MSKLRKDKSLIRPLIDFLNTESAGGGLIVLAAAVAIIWANSPWSEAYQNLWIRQLGLQFDHFRLQLDLRHWINDGLMTSFFFVVGLEIKRELVEGELRNKRKALVPVAAAIGGMIVPAGLFVALNAGTANARGWGIPMATDIALALGVLSIAGSRVSPGTRLYLLTLAIVDDIGAILVIAVFYPAAGNKAFLLVALGAAAVTKGFQKLGVTSVAMYVVIGVAMWWAFREAGIEPTIAGVVMGLLAPTEPMLQNDLIDIDELLDVSTVKHAIESVRIARSSISVVEWLEHKLHRFTSFFVVPLFALANAGIVLSFDSLRASLHSRITWGVIVGLVLGKPLGILLATFFVVRFGNCILPESTDWRDLSIAAVVAGIGFTVSIFVTELAFSVPAAEHAKIGIIASSVCAGAFGLALARFRMKSQTNLDPAQ
jgi:Na+:H+ antiporter, NhaA family